MALYNAPPGMSFGNFSGSGGPQPEEASDPLSMFLQRLQGLFEEDDTDEAPPLPQMPSPTLGQAIGAAYSRTPGAYPTLEQLGQQRMAAEQYNAQLPYKQYQARQQERGARIDRLGRMVNLASLMENRGVQEEYRRAQIQRLGQPSGGSITRGNVRTDIGVYDPTSPTGVSDIDYQLVPQPDGSVQTREIARRPQQVRMQGGFGAMNGEPGRYQINPVTGKLDFNTNLTQMAPVGAVNAAVSNIESKQALDALVGSYNIARQSFGIEYANPSMLARIRAKISQGLSSRQWLRDLEAAGISGPKFLQFDAARKRALNSYVKAQTGAQFSLKELDRYEAQFPLPWDDPETARVLLEALAAAAVGRMQSLITQYGGLQKMLQQAPPEIDRGTPIPDTSSQEDYRGFVRP